MFPSAGRRGFAAVTAAILLAVVAIQNAAAPAERVRAGEASPPQPFEFGHLDGIGALAAPGEPVDHVAIWWDEIIDPSSIPDRTAFSITINGSEPPLMPDSVSVVYSGFAGHEIFGPTGATFMRLDLPTTWTSSDDVRVTYPDGVVLDRALNPAGGREGQTATVWDFGAFNVLGAVVDSAHARDRIMLVLTLPIAETSIPAGDFTVADDADDEVTVESVTPVFTDTGLGVLDIQLDAPIPDTNRSVTLTYAPVGAPMTNARDGGELDDFADLPVELLLPTDSASTTVVATGSVSTATDDGPTAPDPVATTVISPAAGTITIEETSVAAPPPTGYAFFGQQVEISAPPATSADDPLVLRFEIDASLVPAGQDHTSVAIFRDGVLVPECIGAPDPACVSERLPLADGDIAITVLTLEASSWNFGILPPFAFGGFESPVDAGVPNVVSAGRAIPVTFSLGGDRGLAIFEAGSPSVTLVACGTGEGDVVEQTLTAGQSSLSYDAATDTYTYVWKTSKAWEDTCRRLVLDFADGSRATALFDFRR